MREIQSIPHQEPPGARKADVGCAGSGRLPNQHAGSDGTSSQPSKAMLHGPESPTRIQDAIHDHDRASLDPRGRTRTQGHAASGATAIVVAGRRDELHFGSGKQSGQIRDKHKAGPEDSDQDGGLAPMFPGDPPSEVPYPPPDLGCREQRPQRPI